MAFYKVGEHQELTGTSPRRDSPPSEKFHSSHRYMLFTESAYQDLASPDWQVEQGLEEYDDIGAIKTFVYYPPAAVPYIPQPNAKLPAVFIETLRSEVSREYYQLAYRRER